MHSVRRRELNYSMAALIYTHCSERCVKIVTFTLKDGGWVYFVGSQVLRDRRIEVLANHDFYR